MNEIFERVATALEGAEIGYSLRLTRLVDGVSTYTLTYDDGSPPIQFDDNSDAYAHIAAKKRTKAAMLALEAMREPTLEMLSDGNRAARQVRRSGVRGMTLEAQTRTECAREEAAWRAMIDAAINAVHG